MRDAAAKCKCDILRVQESLYPGLSLESKSALCKQLREQGNALFKREQLLHAKHCYLKVPFDFVGFGLDVSAFCRLSPLIRLVWHRR